MDLNLQFPKFQPLTLMWNTQAIPMLILSGLWFTFLSSIYKWVSANSEQARNCLSGLLKPSDQAQEEIQMNQEGSEPEGKKAVAQD